MRFLFVILLLLCGAASSQEVRQEPQLSVAPVEWQGVIVSEYPKPERETVRFPPMPDKGLRALQQEPNFVYEMPPNAGYTVQVPRPPNTLLMTNENVAPWLQRIAQEFPDKAKLWRLTQTAQGRYVWALEIRPQNISSENLRRLAIICRQHGDEPETTAAGAHLIYQLLQNTPRNRNLLNRVALFIIPVANPDGASRKKRHNALGQDLNRDWGRGGTREVSAIMYYLQSWQPHLVVDVHQWVPGDSTQTPMAEAAGGTLGRQAGRLMAQAAKRKGYALSYRSRGVGGALLHQHYGWQRGIDAILLETVHRPKSARQRQIAINTSVAALQRALEFLAQ